MNDDQFAPDPAALWLCQLPGMTAKLVQRLIAARGSAAAILQTPSSVLRELGVPPAMIARLVAGPREVPRVAAGLKGLQRLGIVPLPLIAPSYPQRLHALPQPPLVVYVQGAWPITKPLVAVAEPDVLESSIRDSWGELVHAVAPHIGFAMLRASAADVAPTLVGLPYGLMLARQRLPADLWQRVAGGTTTLISVSPPTAQPDSTQTQTIAAALAALSDALVVLPPVSAESESLVATAKMAGIRAWTFAHTPRDPLVPGTRRLRAGKAGAKALLAALGIQARGNETVQQERLF